ncbi:MAG: hypothetical protein JWQ27_2637 [Ferruginibacter sp.]|nr:hypothetical protein [Ferruginibacter sp.]
MNLALKKIWFAVILIFFVHAVNAQTNFTATIYPTQIAKDEYATLRLIVENAASIKEIQPPSFKNFRVVSGPTQESGMSSVNGATSQYVALSFILQPTKTGKLTLSGASAVVSGKRINAKPVSLTVTNSLSGNAPVNPLLMSSLADDDRGAVSFKDYILKPGEDVVQKVSKNMQLRLATDKTSCYVGEPIVASYKLYTRLKSDSKLSKNPSFNGFSVIDLQQPDATTYTRETINGREFNVYTIRKAQLYPLQPGPVELETATLDNQIDFIKEEDSRRQNIDDGFGGFNISPDAMVSQSVSLSSKAVTIQVKPLPEAGKPASFAGAVGNFRIEWGLEKNNFTTDESGALLVKISGSGNLQLITAPEISWPAGVDGFEPRLIDQMVTTTVPVSGSKVFRFSFAAQQAGTYQLKPLYFSYFNPVTGVYKTDSTGPLTVTVTQGSGKSVYADDIRERRPVSFLNNFINHRNWVIAFVIGLAILGLGIWIWREKNTPPVIEPVKTDIDNEKMNKVLEVSANNQQNPLEETEACLYRVDCIDFYVLLNKEIRQYLAHKFSLSATDISAKTVATVMDRSGIGNNIVLQLQQLLQEIEWRLYTPFEQEDQRMGLYTRAQALIQLINMEFVTVL